MMEHFAKASSPADNAAYVAETAQIRENRKRPENQRPHRFERAEWTWPNAHPRCLRCGAEEPESGQCGGADTVKSFFDCVAGSWNQGLPWRLTKANVRQHTRGTPTGKVTTVTEYQRKDRPSGPVHPKDPEAWLAIDFDGTLSEDIGEYDSHGFAKPGPPVPLMLERVQRWIKEGRTVKILSARAHDPENVKIVHDWLSAHGLPKLEVVANKDSKMIALYDDRAITVERNTGKLFHDVNEDYKGRIGRHRPIARDADNA